MRINKYIIISAVLIASLLLGFGFGLFDKQADEMDKESKMIRIKNWVDIRRSISEFASTTDDRFDSLLSLLEDLRFEQKAISNRVVRIATKVSFMSEWIKSETSVYFDVNKSKIRSADEAKLLKFAKIIRERNPGALIRIEGYTDSSGNQDYNHRLGLKRAEAVRSYLIDRGKLKVGQIAIVSFGEKLAHQVAPDAVGKNGVQNRRVSLAILD